MAEGERPPDTGSPGPGQLDTTASLLARARLGDRSALDLLAARYLALLRRWAHGRLSLRARSLVETDDLVQVTLLRALDHVKEFEPRHEGAFLAYLRRILMNQIRDEIRKASRSPVLESVPEDLPLDGPSPLQQAIGREAFEAYEAALERLPSRQQEAVVLRIEMGFTHQEVAEALELPSANAARMLVARALVGLAEVMDGRA